MNKEEDEIIRQRMLSQLITVPRYTSAEIAKNFQDVDIDWVNLADVKSNLRKDNQWQCKDCLGWQHNSVINCHRCGKIRRD